MNKLTKCSFCNKKVHKNKELIAIYMSIFDNLKSGIHQEFFKVFEKEITFLIPEKNSKSFQNGFNAMFTVCSDNCQNGIEAAIYSKTTRDEIIKDKDSLLLSEEDGSNKFFDMVKDIFDDMAHDTQTEEAVKNICFEAHEEPSKTKRRDLALDALSLDPSCADAWGLMGETEKNIGSRKIGFLNNAVTFSEESLPDECFESDDYPFWLDTDTRPFMRHSYNLALNLWENGEKDEAIEILKSLLDKNPGDNLGVRYTLINWYFNEELLFEMELLLEESFGDDAYDLVFYELALSCATDDDIGIKEYFPKALKLNPHLEKYFSNKKSVPKNSPDTYAIGSESEAAMVAWTISKVMPKIQKEYKKLFAVGTVKTKGKKSHLSLA